MVVVGVAFVVLWRKGFLARVADYVAETREELSKCTWPSFQELKGSTLIVMVTILLLGVFTFCIDFVISMLVRIIT